MSTLYICLMLFAIGFNCGFFVERQISKAEIQTMENSINNANTHAEALLKITTERVESATQSAVNANYNLDKSHESTINALNSQHDTDLANFSLYTKSRNRCPNPLSGSDIAGISENSTREAELDAETDRVIKEAALIADVAADYAESAYQFATVNNCGIKK